MDWGGWHVANNQMYLRCLLCSERLYLAKYYPSTGWYLNCKQIGDTTSPARELNTYPEWLELLVDFLEKHSPYVRRGESGKYDPKGVNTPHGDPTGAISMGEVFRLEYE